MLRALEHLVLVTALCLALCSSSSPPSAVRRLAPATAQAAAAAQATQLAQLPAHHKTRCKACCACKAIQAEDAALQKAGKADEYCTVGRCAEEGSRDLWWCWDSFNEHDLASKWGTDCSGVRGFPACRHDCAFALTAETQAADTIGEFQTWDHDKHLSFGPKTGGPDLPGGDDDDAE
jgi:hypothetical protein